MCILLEPGNVRHVSAWAQSQSTLTAPEQLASVIPVPQSARWSLGSCVLLYTRAAARTSLQQRDSLASIITRRCCQRIFLRRPTE